MTRADLEDKLRAATLALKEIRVTQIDALALIRTENFVFRRCQTEPPTTDAERWEWLAFWLYNSLCEAHGHATACLNQISYAQGRPSKEDETT